MIFDVEMFTKMPVPSTFADHLSTSFECTQSSDGMVLFDVFFKITAHGAHIITVGLFAFEFPLSVLLANMFFHVSIVFERLRALRANSSSQCGYTQISSVSDFLVLS